MNSKQHNIDNLTAEDLRRFAALSERVHYTGVNESFSNHVQVVLKQAVQHVHLSILHFNVDPFMLVNSQSETLEPAVFASFKPFIQNHPLLDIFTKSSKPQALTLQSIMPVARLHKTSFYNEVFAPLKIEDQLVMKLRNKTDLVTIAFDRDTPFSAQEVSLMQLLLPHVQIAWNNWSNIKNLSNQLNKLNENCSAIEDTAVKHLMDRLTRRQREITELVAQGYENRKIAEILHISYKTVGKHLENIFQTLKVHHRAALAAKWQQAKTSCYFSAITKS